MTLSPITQRRIATFKANRRGYVSAILLVAMFVITLFAELIANDRPILVMYKSELLVPMLRTYTEKDTFGGVLESEADYNDPWVQHEICANGWMLRAPIPFDYRSINFGVTRAPAPPTASTSRTMAAPTPAPSSRSRRPRASSTTGAPSTATRPPSPAAALPVPGRIEHGDLLLLGFDHLPW